LSRILIVEDDESVREELCHYLTDAGYDVIEASDGKRALDLLESELLDLVLLDLRLPRVDGMQVLDEIVQKHMPLPVIMISAHGTIQLAVEATKKGAFDFLEKPLKSDRVLITVRNALGQKQLEIEKRTLLEEVRQKYQMVGQSDVMQKVFRLVDRAARSEAKVLVVGENGTGKELVARAIHMNSPRAASRFVAVNCAAVPETLIESELFGHRRGAFTDAISDSPGKFKLASGGTLFLDEIGDMSLRMQSKLLRALEEGEIYPVGSEEPVKIDVRVIAATNKDLEQLIDSGEFRQDLYYRLNVLKIELPPLRERREDIPLLVEHFVSQMSESNGIEPKSFTPAALGYLMGYPWPGNVRQLRNVVEKLMVLYPDVQRFDLDHVVEAVEGLGTQPEPQPRSLREAREAFEKRFIEERLAANDWKILQTAKELGIERTHLWKKMKRYGIVRPGTAEALGEG